MKFLCYGYDYGGRETLTLYKIMLKFYTINIGPESLNKKINTSIAYQNQMKINLGEIFP